MDGITITEIERDLNAMVKDCELWLKPLGRFRFKHQCGPIFGFETAGDYKHFRWHDAGFTITADATGKRCFTVERIVELPGDRETPPDVDVVYVDSFPMLHEAFTRVVVEWFKTGVGIALENAAEAKMFEQEQADDKAMALMEETFPHAMRGRIE